ncbi:MAG: clan AA aspartic protease [Treponema sp.]|jgi:clan AA aspartic protease|nr:clan AA aspartic protease [Treponema sp.]
MSLVRTKITLKNVKDIIRAEDGHIKEAEIRKVNVEALVDTGAWTLVINEKIRKKLGLELTGTDTGTLADGAESVYNMAGPLEVWWKKRRTICEALVLPNAAEVLLGAIPLEAMDLTINPRKEEITGAHGDQIVHSVKPVNRH